jgi:signal transduction histidine kinase
MKAGCGTSIFCTECGAAKSIKETKDNNIQATYECRVTSNRNNILLAYDLRVITTPLNISEEKYLLVYLENIEAEKRKDTLEKVFFHDVLNTAGAIKNIIDILPEIQDKSEMLSFLDMLKSSSSQLLNEIIFQRMIINAEKNELSVDIKNHSVNSILESSYSLYSKHQKAEGKLFEVSYLGTDAFIETDKTILVRSLGNLIKNALEATCQGKKIKLFATEKSDFVYFNVWNEGVIPEEVQLQIFQRSFSTKAKSGRGIGTYSVKLFVENYLRGKVFFISSESEQTCFTIALPFKTN